MLQIRFVLFVLQVFSVVLCIFCDVTVDLEALQHVFKALFELFQFKDHDICFCNTWKLESFLGVYGLYSLFEVIV